MVVQIHNVAVLYLLFTYPPPPPMRDKNQFFLGSIIQHALIIVCFTFEKETKIRTCVYR